MACKLDLYFSIEFLCKNISYIFYFTISLSDINDFHFQSVSTQVIIMGIHHIFPPIYSQTFL